MKKTFRAYGILLTLMGGAVLGGENDPRRTVSPNPDAELSLNCLQFDDNSWLREGDLFYKDSKGLKVTVRDKNRDFDFTRTPHTVKIHFQLIPTDPAANSAQEITGNLCKNAPEEITNWPDFDPQKTFDEYLKKLRQNPLRIAQKFSWTGPEGTDLFGLGSPTLFFINTYKSHTVNFHDILIQECNKEEHKTYLKLKYWFDDPAESHHHLICTIVHSAASTSMHNIKYLDDQKCLLDVASVIYTTVPKNLQGRLPMEEYAGISEGHPDSSAPILALTPSPNVENLSGWIQPKENALGKHYRLDSESKVNSNYIWTDGAGNFFIAQEVLYEVYEQNAPQTNPTTGAFSFNNKDNAAKLKLSVLKKTSTPLYPPQNVLIQLNLDPGYYKGNNTNTNNSITQTWIKVAENSTPVDVTLNHWLINGQWACILDGYSTRPEIINNEILFDLSTVLHLMNDDQYNRLKEYFLAAKWIERKPLLITYAFQDKNIQEKKDACKWLTELLHEQYPVKLSGADVTIYTPKNSIQSVWAVEFGTTRFQDTKHAIIVPRIGEPLGEYTSQLKEVEFLDNEIDVSHAVWLGNQNQVEKIRFKKFNIQDFWNHKHWNPQLGLTVENIAKLFSKAVGLETLMMPNITLGDILGDPFGRTYFHKGLLMNASTLTHLNCSGTHLTHLSPYANFQLDSKGFVQAVKQMTQLRSINVLNTHLTNQDVVGLAKALQDKRNLVEIHMDMPYWVSSTFEAAIRYPQELYSIITNSADVVDFAILTFAITGIVITTPVVAPRKLLEYLIKDITNSCGIDSIHTLSALAKIENLSQLKLAVWGVRNNEDQIRQLFNGLKSNMTPVNIEFVR